MLRSAVGASAIAPAKQVVISVRDEISPSNSENFSEQFFDPLVGLLVRLGFPGTWSLAHLEVLLRC